MPLRETAMLVALVNHPELIDENFEHVECLDLVHPDLQTAARGADRRAWRMTLPTTGRR